MSAIQTRSKVNKNFEAHALARGRIDYDEVFAHMARIEAISIFLAFASYMGFIVYQIDVKSAFLYGTIDEEVYVSQPPGFVDLKFHNKMSWCDEFEELMKNRFQMSFMGELTFFLGLQVQQKEDGIFIIQDKYVAKILTKFDFLSVKTVSTLIETQKPLVKDEEATDVDVHLYSACVLEIPIFQTILRRRNKRLSKNVVEPELRTIVEIAPMADNRTMEELLQAPTEGYGEAIVIPDVSNDVIKLMMFPYSLEGSARVWYDKEPPNSILTWEDLVNKFVNQFFPPSKTTHLKNEISRFTQRFEETFGETWE
nr:copia protein [Tanacetum cinerariifolium]